MALVRARQAPRQSASTPARHPVGARIRVLACYAGLMAVGQGPVLLYLPLFGAEAVGMSLQASAMALAVSSGVAIVARIAWGALSARLRSMTTTLVFLAAGSLASVLVIWLAQWSGALALWIGAIGFGCTAAVWSTLVYVDVLRGNSPQSTGRSSGLVHMSFLAGLGVSPAIFGWIVDRHGSYTLAWWLAAAAFAAAGLVLAASAVRARRAGVEPDIR